LLLRGVDGSAGRIPRRAVWGTRFIGHGCGGTPE
jgi:hypothetical protein